MDRFHVSVLLQEVIDYLQIKHGKKYIDATLGGGGHTREMISRGGIVLGVDADLDAISFIKKNFKFQISNLKLTLVQGNFNEIGKIARENGFEKVSGILFDLGVSGHQFDEAQRGFSFSKEGPLDMRMDTALTVSAKDLVNGLTEQELEELFTRLGEERFARKIADSIVKARAKKQIATTRELAEIVKQSVYKSHYDIHPATRVFQALRIAVNDELNVLREALPQAVDLLEDKGRIAVISFHSLEERIVKHAFIKFMEQGRGTIITKKPLVPTEPEVRKNPRSRSAKLRVFERSI